MVEQNLTVVGTFNTAHGGGVTGSLANHVLTAGIAYRNLANIRGEAAISLLYMNPIDDFVAIPQLKFRVAI